MSLQLPAVRPQLWWGVAVALVSAAAFGTAGALGKPLIHAGWSPAAVVTLRVGGGALLLLPAVVWSMRGRWWLLPRNLPTVAAYGLFGVAGAQLAYFSAVETLSVGIALLLEYLAVVLIVGWLWVVHGQRPDRLTGAGVVLAVAGLTLVLGLFSGIQVSGIGVVWALFAAVGLAVYFVLSAEQAEHSLPPIALAGLGLLLGALVLVGAGLVGILALHGTTSSVELNGAPVPWWVPMSLLALVAAALSYWTGIAAARAVGARLASFLGLTEVLFAVGFAWVLLGERPSLVQGLGGILVIAGVVAVRAAELRRSAASPAAEPQGPPPEAFVDSAPAPSRP